MTRKVIFGIAAVLAVVVVAAVVAVLVSGKTEDEVQMPSTNQTDTINATTTPLPGSDGPSENTGPGGLTPGHRWTPGPTARPTAGPPREVFMQTNNGCK